MAFNFQSSAAVKAKIQDESYKDELMNNEIINDLISVASHPQKDTLNTVEVASEQPSSDFRAFTKSVWKSTKLFKNDAQFLLEANIASCSADQCNSEQFWSENVAYGSHLTFEQWQPIFKAVYTAIRQAGVVSNAYVLFAQQFLNTIHCTDQQRKEMFQVIQNPKENPENTMYALMQKKYIEKTKNYIEQNHRTAVQELKRKFKG